MTVRRLVGHVLGVRTRDADNLVRYVSIEMEVTHLDGETGDTAAPTALRMTRELIDRIRGSRVTIDLLDTPESLLVELMELEEAVQGDAMSQTQRVKHGELMHRARKLLDRQPDPSRADESFS